MKIVATMCASLVWCASALAQSEVGPEVLVQRLADEAQRAASREQLLALGARAMPALAASLSAGDDALVGEVLAILTQLGPKAGAAMPQVRVLMASDTALIRDVVATMAELAPWCDPTPDPFELSKVQFQLRLRNLRGTGSGDLLLFQRLQARSTFPRDADLETLLRYAGGRNALRVELAIEHLGQLGAAAAAALPRLREVLERPEPRILTTERTVPVHRKAALAVLSIAPEGELAALARDVLSGKRPPPVLASRPVPDRVQKRVGELVAELALPAKRAAATANLVALGEPSAVPVAEVLARGGDVATIDAALAVLRDLGEHGAAAVPQLVDAISALSAEHTIAVLRALEVTAPWTTDLMPPIGLEKSVGSLSHFGRPIRGVIDAPLLTAVQAAEARLSAAMQVDPTASLAELETLLRDPQALVREFALVVVAGRGEAARPLLPALAAMLDAAHPQQNETEWVDARKLIRRGVDRTPFVQRLAARAIVAAAAPDDPLLVQARAVLEQPEPK